MSDADILLNNDTNDEEKREAADNIIMNHDLCLDAEQIMQAFKKVLVWLNCDTINNKERVIFIVKCLSNQVLNINKNMYTAIILALCDDFNPSQLINFVVFNDETNIVVGLSELWPNSAITSYKKILDYYEFDVNVMEHIPEKYKQEIQDYRVEKYSGKLTKCAIKNE